MLVHVPGTATVTALILPVVRHNDPLGVTPNGAETKRNETILLWSCAAERVRVTNPKVTDVYPRVTDIYRHGVIFQDLVGRRSHT